MSYNPELVGYDRHKESSWHDVSIDIQQDLLDETGGEAILPSSVLQNGYRTGYLTQKQMIQTTSCNNV